MTNTNTSPRIPRWLLEKSENYSQNHLFDKDLLLLPDGKRVKDLSMAGADVDDYCQQTFGASFSSLVDAAQLNFERGTDSAVQRMGRVMRAIKLGEPALIFNDILEGIERELLSYANQGYADAKMQLGLLYCSMGTHFGHAEKEGLSWLKEAFHCDHSDAPAELGNYYLRAGEWDKAANYLRKGDRQKCAQSTFRLAQMYHQGAGKIEKNLPKAFKLYGQASMRGYPDATVEMVELFLGNPTAFSLPATPEDLLREAIADGLPKAMYWLADMFETGSHARVDIDEAVALYQQAAELAFPIAELKMGNIHDQNHHDAFASYKDPEQAEWWYQIAANNPENGEVRKRAYLALGDIGMVTQRYALAHEWFLSAARFGSVTADRLAATAAIFHRAQQRGNGGN